LPVQVYQEARQAEGSSYPLVEEQMTNGSQRHYHFQNRQISAFLINF